MGMAVAEKLRNKVISRAVRNIKRGNAADSITAFNRQPV
jgi:hypothetical protein